MKVGEGIRGVKFWDVFGVGLHSDSSKANEAMAEGLQKQKFLYFKTYQKKQHQI